MRSTVQVSGSVPWRKRSGKAVPEHLGVLVNILSPTNSASACEQFEQAYTWDYGWQTTAGFTMTVSGNLLYPYDPPLPVLYQTTLRDEIIRIYSYGWVSITQPDGSFVVSRLG